MTTTRDVDPMSIDPTPATPCTADDCKIVMYPLDMNQKPDGMHPVPLIVATLKTTTIAPSTIAIIPAIPLLENTDYVVGVKSGLTDMQGLPLAAAQTFDLLKIAMPFIDAMGNVADVMIPGTTGTLEQALECSTVTTTGMLATADVVKGNATALEKQVMHERWLPAFAALEGLPTPVPRTDVLMAFTYKTQSITHDMDVIKNGLLFQNPGTCTPGCWEQLLGPGTVRTSSVPLVDLVGSQAIASAAGVVDNLCVALCEQGALCPNPADPSCVPKTMCVDMNGRATTAVADATLCRTAVGVVTGRLARARLYDLKGYAAQVGGPFQTTPGKFGTFTAATIAQPRVIDLQMWVVVGTGTPAAGRYPVAIFQHGLGSQKETGFYIANTFASTGLTNDPAGWATVMIDLPFHGSRASDLIHNDTGQPCNVDPADVVCGPAPGLPRGQCIDKNTMQAPCDGKQDPSGTGFLGLNLFATRDNFRQGTIDQLTLIRALEEESKPGRALDYLDGTRIGYVGQSLGGITGGNLAAYATSQDLKAVVLNVPGGGLVQNILVNTVPEISAPLFAGLNQAGVCQFNDPADPGKGCVDSAGYRQFKVLAQWVLDPGDPLANTIGVKDDLPGRMPIGVAKVLMQMSKPDPVVPNVSAYALATGYGFKIDGTDPHFEIYDFTNAPAAHVGSGCHAFLLAPICGQCLFDNLCQSLGAQLQAAEFIDTEGATIGPEVRTIPALGAAVDCMHPCP
jgi:hypothetical protein